MSFRRMRRAWTRTGALTSLIALIGLAAVPSVPAEDEQHCAFLPVARLATGEIVTADPVCFATIAEAISFGTAGRVDLPAETTGSDLLAAQALGELAELAIDPLAGNGTNGGNTAIHFKGPDGTGSSASVFNIYCTGNEWWDVSPSFDNAIDSTRNPCHRTKHHDGESLTGYYRSTWGQFATGTLAAEWRNRANSVSYVP